MNYVIFDMEWNQPMPGMRLEYQNGMCLSNEIIQIGAVRTDENAQILDTFTALIKPQRLKHMHWHVRKLTGITEKDLKAGTSLEEAITAFKDFCGSDFALFSWGYDDIDVLDNNLRFFGMDTSWIPACYNLQMIYCAQTDNENRQYALSTAAESLSVVLDKPMHNALTDAYVTAMIAQKLDVKKGISEYKAMVFRDRSIPEHMKNICYRKNYIPQKEYAVLYKHTRLENPACCRCGEPLDVTLKAQNGVYDFLVWGKCGEHGEFVHSYKIHKHENENFSATELCYSVNDYNRAFFEDKFDKLEHAEEYRKQKNAERRKIYRAKKRAAKKAAKKAEKEPVVS